MIYDILKPWQKEFLKLIHDNKRICGMVSRQQGKSFLVSFACVESAVLENQTWIVISTCERQSIEFLKKALKITEYFRQCLSGTRLSFTYENNSSEIRYNNGGRIIAVPCSPSTIRGLTGNIACDEVAFWENPYEVWEAISPMMTSKHNGDLKCILISTPAGQSGLFYDIWEKNQDFVKIKKTIFDVGLSEADIIELKKNCIDEAVFNTEFCCEFMDSNSTLFSYELLRNCIYQSMPSGNAKTYLGIDIGRSHDKTAISILKEISKLYYLDHVETLQNKEFEEQFKYICKIIDQYSPAKVCIDATGIGAQISEQLRKKYPSLVVEIKFNNNNKNEMFGNLKQKFGTSELFIPDIEEIINDLHKIKRVVSASGNLSYKASSDDTGHADIATSLALAVYATTKSRQTFLPIAF